ncbi:hypothetical protein Vi05172_g3267 [Venturia inaequalis]|nr:hypothetical protein Vi05172_g3267 [Venturia inaequalis]
MTTAATTRLTMKEAVPRPKVEGWKALRNAEATGGETGPQQLQLLHNMTRTVLRTIFALP